MGYRIDPTCSLYRRSHIRIAIEYVQERNKIQKKKCMEQPEQEKEKHRYRDMRK
jgi:hypothetical protein